MLCRLHKTESISQEYSLVDYGPEYVGRCVPAVGVIVVFTLPYSVSLHVTVRYPTPEGTIMPTFKLTLFDNIISFILLPAGM